MAVAGSVGFQASDPKTWFNPLSNLWTFGPGVTWSVFNTGRYLANIDIQKALADLIALYKALGGGWAEEKERQ